MRIPDVKQHSATPGFFTKRKQKSPPPRRFHLDTPVLGCRTVWRLLWAQLPLPQSRFRADRTLTSRIQSGVAVTDFGRSFCLRGAASGVIYHRRGGRSSDGRDALPGADGFFIPGDRIQVAHCTSTTLSSLILRSQCAERYALLGIGATRAARAPNTAAPGTAATMHTQRLEERCQIQERRLHGRTGTVCYLCVRAGQAVAGGESVRQISVRRGMTPSSPNTNIL